MLDEASYRMRRDRFERLYEANYHRILGYALRRLGRDEAADVVAETFLVAWRRVDDVPEGEATLLWLYAVARRVTANQIRGRHRRERLTATLSHALSPRPDGVSAGDSAGAAGVAFARLRRNDRELLALLAWEELDVRQIAQVYGCSPNAARIRIHRARRRYRRELARLGVFDERGRGPEKDWGLANARVGVKTEESA